jgi:hypothetical protein
MIAHAARPDYLNSSLESTDVSRRGFLKSAGAAVGSFAMSMTAQGPALARPAQKSRGDLGGPVRVSKERLSALATKFYSVFNERNILAPISAEKHSARFDVDLRRIITFTRVPETGERVKVSGLLAVPVGKRGSLPRPIVAARHDPFLRPGPLEPDAA